MPSVIVVAIIAISSTAALHAQRGAGGAHSGGPNHAGDRVMHAMPPEPEPIPSADHPLPYNFNAVRPAPVLGREPIPAPFSVPPDFYTRQHPLPVPYGYSYGYGYTAPDSDGAYTSPPPPPPAPAAETPRQATEPAPAPVAALPLVLPNGPKTMYVIPGCYGGNLPPMRARLPKGCDIAKVRIIRPLQ